MSPSSSSTSRYASVNKTAPSRIAAENVTTQDRKAVMDIVNTSPVHYTCFIRLPFPRGEFEDPQQVEWDTNKDRALWKIISKATDRKEIKWEEMSAKFDVSLPFLLQQGAWLYERHFASMRAQMKKLGASTMPGPLPPDSTGSSTAGAGGEMMHRTSSRGMLSSPSATSYVADKGVQKNERRHQCPTSRTVHCQWEK